jgi:hypothetical protein
MLNLLPDYEAEHSRRAEMLVKAIEMQYRRTSAKYG